MRIQLIVVFFTVMLCGCMDKCRQPVKTEQPPQYVLVNTPDFNADSAYFYLARQVAFGPRVPNTPAHIACGNWLDSMLRSFADTVYLQTGQVKAFDGTLLHFKNIIAAFNPQNPHRVLLAAHWDTRPFADQDPDVSKRNQPIDGANDGASGVAVLLEIARQLKKQPVQVGVDIILFDVEDYGQPENSNYPYMPDSYCLGSQYWAKNPHVPGYRARFGILLDMVGAKGSVFPMEQYSLRFAPSLVRRVWNNAALLGYSSYFSFTKSSQPVIDDHYYINTMASIPTINIIYLENGQQHAFGSFWHTHRDNMDIIDKEVLRAVGQTVLQTVYQEDAGSA
ncbi:MAG: glutamine cyclotransferase [Chitinophagales bacterium]|nr:MAG: glutamine cyclotransferase [Chitinophagales bacterium]